MKYLFVAGCVALVGALGGWAAWRYREWRMERWVRGADDKPGLFTLGGRVLTVTSQRVARKLLEDPSVRVEVTQMAPLSARHGLDAAHFVLAGEGWSTNGLLVKWDQKAMLRWMRLRVRDRDAAKRLLQGVNRWGEGAVPMWLLGVAWVQRLDDEEKTFLASLVRASQLPQLARLPGGVAAWVRAGVRRGEDAPVAWALSQGEYEALITRHGEHVSGVPRKLSQSEAGLAGLRRWVGEEFEEQLVAGIAASFPGSVAELRKVLAEL